MTIKSDNVLSSSKAEEKGLRVCLDDTWDSSQCHISLENSLESQDFIEKKILECPPSRKSSCQETQDKFSQLLEIEKKASASKRSKKPIDRKQSDHLKGLYAELIILLQKDLQETKAEKKGRVVWDLYDQWATLLHQYSSSTKGKSLSKLVLPHSLPQRYRSWNPREVDKELWVEIDKVKAHSRNRSPSRSNKSKHSEFTERETRVKQMGDSSTEKQKRKIHETKRKKNPTIAEWIRSKRKNARLKRKFEIAEKRMLKEIEQEKIQLDNEKKKKSIEAVRKWLTLKRSQKRNRMIRTNSTKRSKCNVESVATSEINNPHSNLLNKNVNIHSSSVGVVVSNIINKNANVNCNDDLVKPNSMNEEICENFHVSNGPHFSEEIDSVLVSRSKMDALNFSEDTKMRVSFATAEELVSTIETAITTGTQPNTDQEQ